MESPIKVLLVDDHPVVREGLRAMLSADPGIEVVGEADSGEEGIEEASRWEPDVVLTDIRMPGLSGIELTKRVKAAWPSVCVIVLTMYDNEMYVLEALRAGAAGYLLKDCSRELLSHTIRAVMGGGAMVKRDLLRRAMGGGLNYPSRLSEGRSDSAMKEQLTMRELEVLRLVAQGRINKEIATELSLAEITVKKHVQTIIGKLGVSDRTQAAILAVRQGIVE